MPPERHSLLHLPVRANFFCISLEFRDGETNISDVLSWQPAPKTSCPDPAPQDAFHDGLASFSERRSCAWWRGSGSKNLVRVSTKHFSVNAGAVVNAAVLLRCAILKLSAVPDDVHQALAACWWAQGLEYVSSLVLAFRFTHNLLRKLVPHPVLFMYCLGGVATVGWPGLVDLTYT